MRAKPRGFELVFTQPVDPETAGNVESYAMRSWTYRHHSAYGDKPQNTRDLNVTSAHVSSHDLRSVTLEIEGLEPHYVHELRLPGIRNRAAQPVLHPIAYYTLNRIPVVGN